MLIAAVPTKINSIRKFGNSHVPLKLLRKVEREQHLGNCALEESFSIKLTNNRIEFRTKAITTFSRYYDCGSFN